MSTPNQLEDAILHKLVHTQFFLELDFFQPKVKFWKDRSKARLEGGSGFPTSSLLPAWDPPRRRGRRYTEEHDRLIVRLSHLLGSAGRHKRADLVEVLFENGNPTGGFEFSALSIPPPYFH